MKTVLLGCVAVFLVACGASTSGAKCGEGTKEVNSKCVVDGAGGGTGDGGTDGVNGGVEENGAGGSSDAGGAPAGGGGDIEGGAGGEPVDIGPTGEPLKWGDGGYISASENQEGIRGWWWFIDDCADTGDLPCLERDESLTGPDGKSGWSTTGDTVCVKGTIETISDFTKQWGGVFGFSFALPDGTMVPYDASDYRGFAFDVTGTSPEKTQVMIEAQSSVYYKREIAIPTQNAVVTFEGSEAPKQEPGDPVPLDPTQLVSISFVILPITGPLDFCVGNIRVLE
jgi:hypothetical protein